MVPITDTLVMRKLPVLSGHERSVRVRIEERETFTFTVIGVCYVALSPKTNSFYAGACSFSAPPDLDSAASYHGHL